MKYKHINSFEFFVFIVVFGFIKVCSYSVEGRNPLYFDIAIPPQDLKFLKKYFCIPWNHETKVRFMINPRLYSLNLYDFSILGI